MMDATPTAAADVPLDAAAPCACGSRLSASLCCAQKPRAMLPVSEVTQAQADALAAAFEAFRAGDPAPADATCRAMLAEQPGLIPALHMLADLRHTEGIFDAEIALRRRIVALLPLDIAHLVRFCTALIKQGDKNEAVAFARRAVWMLPGDARANWIMALAFAGVHCVADAEYHFDRALVLAEEIRPELLVEAAEHFHRQGKLDKARSVLARLAPDDSQALTARLTAASIEESAGQLDSASAIIEPLVAMAPRNPGLQMVRARVAMQRRDFAGALAMVESCGPGALEKIPGLILLRGRILGELRRYDEAFAAFDAGKALAAEQARIEFRTERFEESIQAMRTFATPMEMSRLPRAPLRDDVPQPIFITGFPRSGTTMVEQTLTMHTRIAAGGELGALNDVLAHAPGLLRSRLGYPGALAELLVADRRHGLVMMRDDYLHNALPVVQPKPGAGWFTDKSLMNDGRIPSLTLMFPASPILHIVRHPLDSVLSVYSQLLPDVSGYSMKLQTAARFFKAGAEAAEHYRQTLPSIRYLRVRYEDILADQQGEVTRMLDFIGEPFEAACLSFQDNTRYAPTLSYAQVRSKLSAERRYRYKPYLKHLGPAIDILEPVIAMLGYTIEA